MFTSDRTERFLRRRLLVLGVCALVAAGCGEATTETGAVPAPADAPTRAEGASGPAVCDRPPSGAGFLDDATRWVGETPAAVLEYVSDADETPVIWTGENYGIGLDPMRDITEDDVADLLRSAAELQETEARRVTSAFTLSVGDGWGDMFGASPEKMAQEWAAAGVVDGSGRWFLDIADLSRTPVMAPTRTGASAGGASFVQPSPWCADPGLGLLSDLSETPFGDTDLSDMAAGPAWQAMIDAALRPGSGALLNASGARSMPGVGDVFTVGLAADISGPGWDALLDSMQNPVIGFGGPADGGSAPIGIMFEIGADGRLLSAEFDLSDLATEMVLAAVPAVLLPSNGQDMRIESFWRVTWRDHSADGLDASEDAPGVWDWPAPN